MELRKIQAVVLETLKTFVDENGIETDGEITLNQRLIGKSGIFDSMDLVNFLVDLEEILEEKFDREISLQDERAMSRSHSPFMNGEELSKFIIEINAENE
jgi:acyl carrier protein